MSLADLLTPQRITLDIQLSSRKRLLEHLSKQLTKSDNLVLDERDFFEALCEREQLGSTALGHGVAIPHARLDGLDDSRACMVRLSTALNFDAPDNQPINLVIGIAVPQSCTDNHVRVVDELATCLSDENFRIGLYDAPTAAVILDFIQHWQVPQ